MKPIFNSLWAEKASFLWFIRAVFRQNNPTLSQSSPLFADRLRSSIHFIITALISFLSILSIVVKMATGSGWQQYYCPAGQGKFSSSSASSVSVQSGITMEYTQDLHLKMSKKIAQLTKVRSIIMGPIPTIPEQSINPWLRPCTSRCRVKTGSQTPSGILPI